MSYALMKQCWLNIVPLPKFFQNSPQSLLISLLTMLLCGGGQKPMANQL